MSRAALLPPVLLGLVVLLLAQMVGLAASALLGLRVPGVVLGIMLLVVLGILRPTRAVVRAAEPAATPLLAHLQLLFVPPSVGIVLELRSLAENALPLALAVGSSFLVPLIVSGMVLQALLRRQAGRQERRQDRRQARGTDRGPDRRRGRGRGDAGEADRQGDDPQPGRSPA